MKEKPLLSREKCRGARSARGFDPALRQGRPSTLSVDVAGFRHQRLSFFEEDLTPQWVMDWGVRGVRLA